MLRYDVVGGCVIPWNSDDDRIRRMTVTPLEEVLIAGNHKRNPLFCFSDLYLIFLPVKFTASIE